VTDLARATRATFEPHVGEAFATTLTVAETGEPLELAFVLERVGAAGGAAPGEEAREPFSLQFRAAFAQVLPQAIYPLRHERLGTLEIFLVPIGRDGDGVRYEAVFT